jgi:hypothetical protein
MAIFTHPSSSAKLFKVQHSLASRLVAVIKTIHHTIPIFYINLRRLQKGQRHTVSAIMSFIMIPTSILLASSLHRNHFICKSLVIFSTNVKEQNKSQLTSKSTKLISAPPIVERSWKRSVHYSLRYQNKSTACLNDTPENLCFFNSL